ncbi:hypothetical protein EF847_13025 [Actinobacteria bacterium YIM 96077]|nr:hypothetical protein EF847_13025 [Actinobacteria bacterium YIM 96077]
MVPVAALATGVVLSIASPTATPGYAGEIQATDGPAPASISAGTLAATLTSDSQPADRPTEPPTDELPSDHGEQQRRDPQEAYEEALRGAQTVAVAEAQQLMQEVLAEIDLAEQDVERARAEAEQAREAEEEARKQVKVAVQALERSEREIEQLKAEAANARSALGSVISEAHQNNGLSTVGVLVGADTPEDLNDRYLGLQTLLDAGDTALGQLAEDQAELRNAVDRLEGQRKERERLAEEAAQKRVEKEAAEEEAEAAQAELEDQLDDYEHALQLAEDAMLEDYERYMEQLDEATAVGEHLRELTEEDYGSGSGSGTFVRPGTGQTTSTYGSRMHPILGYVKMHTGTDFSAGDGNIYAADSGTVVEATYNSAYGYMVVIDHGDVDGSRLSTLYAHQSGLTVSTGQRVEKGQVIGRIGSTGYSTGPHLHFEVRLDGEHTDPSPWLDGAATP